MNWATAWLRVILWISPGCFLLLIFLIGDGLIRKLGLSPGDGRGLLLLSFTCVLVAASYWHAVLWRKQHNDDATNLIWQGFFFCFCQIFITPLVAGILGFACCVLQIR
jgi:hypothetical protein